MAETPVHQIFRNSADPVFGIGWSGRIGFWNEPCARLTGLAYCQVEGIRCFEVFGGRDLDGKPLCRPDCDVTQGLARGSSTRNYDMVIKDPAGEKVVVNVSALATPLALKSAIDVAGFLVLRRLEYQRLIQRLAAEKANRERPAGDRRIRLSAREIEVLSLSSEGLNTRRIAERLCISGCTVRNHVANILAKLQVHSRAEAVCLAMRLNLF